MARERIYLDHAATTPLSARAREALLPLLEAGIANPSSPHLEGRAAKDALEEARSSVSRTLGCRPREVIFTSGATEAAAIGMHGAAWPMAQAGRKRIVVSAVEHPAVMETAEAMAAMGLELEIVPVDALGRVDPEAFLAAAREDTALAALMLASHEAGVVQPVAEVAEALRSRRIPLVCDACLGPGRLPVARSDLPADLLLLSGHKFGGPVGSGALVVRRGVRVAPFLHGGLQEERLRPGTENVPGCAALAAALAEACAARPERAARYSALIDGFLGGLADLEGMTPLGSPDHRVPGIVTLEVGGVEGEAAMINMDLEGFAVATGSTCALGSSDPSPGLLAMGLSKRRAASTLRISVGEGTTTKHMDSAASTLGRVVLRLRALAQKS